MALATISVPVSQFNNRFLFKTSQTNISATTIDSSTNYAIILNNWTDICFSDGIVTSGKINENAYSEDPPIYWDMIRYVGEEVYNTSHCIGLFNLQSMYPNVTNMDTSFNSILKSDLEINCGTENNPITGTDNLIYKTLVKILESSGAYVITDLFTPTRDITQWISLPFIAGDTISLDIKYGPIYISNENDSTIPDRNYRINISLS